MIRQLRRKFILIMMTISVLFLSAILLTLYYSTKASYEHRSMGMLQMALKESYEMRQQDPFSSEDVPPPPEKRVPVLIAEKKPDGTVHILHGQALPLDEQDLLSLISRAESSLSEGGIFPDQGLRWLRGRTGPDGTIRYAFTDTYPEQDALRGQLIHSLIIGILALAAFFTLSVFLSHWATRPIEQAWKTQQQFVSDASHELKTPLTVILANISLLRQSPHLTDDTDLQRVDHIASEARRMKQLTESLLLLARSDDSVRMPAPSSFVSVDLSYLAESSIATFEPLAFEMGKSISGEIEAGITVKGDESKLQQLVSILLDNGCKYSREKSSVLARLSRDGADAVFTVCSEGTPLTSDEISQLFHRFYRADPSRGTVAGFGLGLSIAQCICTEHGGKISASTDGVSTNTFTVRLPLESS